MANRWLVDHDLCSLNVSYDVYLENEGRRAYLDGVDYQDNPYQFGRPEFDLWDYGWHRQKAKKNDKASINC